MNPKEHGNLTIEWCGPSHMKADDSVAAYLREQGYLVLAPSDTSPVAELVRNAVCLERGSLYRDDCGSDDRLSNEAWALLDSARTVETDPSVRAWVERGLK